MHLVSCYSFSFCFKGSSRLMLIWALSSMIQGLGSKSDDITNLKLGIGPNGMCVCESQITKLKLTQL